MAEGKHAGRVAVVTGGANGMGREIALRLAEGGADVAVLDRADGAPVAAAVKERGGRALALSCDVTDEASVARAVADVTTGLGPADILVNNVGIYPYDPFPEIDLALWRKVLSINLDSVFIVSSAFVPAMRTQGWGRVVNMASNTFHGG